MELEYQFWVAKKEKNNVKTCRKGVHKAVIYDKCSILFFEKVLQSRLSQNIC